MDSSTLAPEILILIGAFLSRPSLTICLRVCKHWKQVFEQFVWDTVIYSDSKAPGFIALQSHRHLVKNIRILSNDFKGELLDLTFPNLGTLHVQIYPNVNLIDFILAQDSVKSLHLNSSLRSSPVPAPFWKRLSGFKNLQVLKIDHVLDYTSETEATMFWNACARIQDLYLFDIEIFSRNSITSNAALDTLQRMTFPRLETLNITNRRSSYHGPVGSFIERCPNLKSLTLTSFPNFKSSIFEELVRIAKTSPLTFQALEILHLMIYGLEDIELAIVLSALGNIKKLLIRSGFGPRSLDALRPYFGTLRRLNLVTSPTGFSSNALQVIMSSCPLLERLVGRKIEAKDILQGPWICTNLRYLEICLDLGIYGTSDMNALVLDQVSRLTQLKQLRLGYDRMLTKAIQPIQLTLKGGLDKLSTLKHLRLVRVPSNISDLGDAEVDWIVAHWKTLERLQGPLNKDTLTNKALRMRLKNELPHFTL